MAHKFTYYYGDLANPLKAKVEEGTGKGQCAAGEGRCEEHPTREQWKARQKEFNVNGLHFDLVEKAEENAVTLEEYNDPNFNKWFHGWTLTINIVDVETADILKTQVYEDIRDRRTAEEIVLNYPCDKRKEVPEGIIVNKTDGHFFQIDPYYAYKRFSLDDLIMKRMSERKKNKENS